MYIQILQSLGEDQIRIMNKYIEFLRKTLGVSDEVFLNICVQSETEEDIVKNLLNSIKTKKDLN